MANEVQTRGDNRGKDFYVVPLADVYTTDEEYVITADMPAVSKEGLDITMDNNTLTIKGAVDNDELSGENLKYREFSLYNYLRTFTVGNDIDTGKISAKLNNGVLTVTLPKKEEVKPKKIEITVN